MINVALTDDAEGPSALEPTAPPAKVDRHKLAEQKIKKLEARVTQLEKPTKNLRVIALDLGAQGMAKEIFPLMAPADPVGVDLERVGRDYDGGYIMVKHDAEVRIAYSLGINRDVSWDLIMAERGYQIYQYDHTIETLPIHHPNFHWKKLGITGKSQVTDELTSLEEQFQANGHSDAKDLILKIDIEGHEWDVFSEMSKVDLSRFSQIVVECHGFGKLHGLAKFRKMRQSLQNLAETHQVVHVHGNNNSPMVVVGGIPTPQTLELTWLRRDICEFTPCSRTFPTPLDQPNNPNFADHMLGRFSFF
jgi:hypothetical protein